MKLYVMRHGDARKSEPYSLSKRGRKESMRIARALYDAGVKPDMILCSGELRAKETAEIVSERLGAAYKEAEGLNPEDDAHLWLENIIEKSKDVVVVGHLPNLSHLISLLRIGEERDLVELKKSSVACLESSDEGWVLSFLITPELL